MRLLRPDRALPRAVGATLAAVAALARAPAPDAAVTVPADFVNEVLVAGLDRPNSLAFLPDGRALLTEQFTGRVRMVVNGRIAATDPLLTVPGLVAVRHEQGLQGIAVDPRWPDLPHVYLYYTHVGGRCWLVRYTASGDLVDPAGENLTLADPLVVMDDIPDSDPNHQAGCLRFGPGARLFVSLGEDEDFCAAGDSTTLKGQVLRLRVERLPPGPGGPVPRALITPPGNPLASADSNARLVWAYGLRNPWRFQVDLATGIIYLADVGEEDFEELNEVLAGDYLGWPYREGFLVMPRATCPEPGGEGSIAFKAPIVAMGRGTELTAISSAGCYRPVAGGSANWPADYDGDVFYGEYYSGFLRRLKRTEGGWSAAPPVAGQPDTVNWATGLTRAAEFLVGPDGSLWWLQQFDPAGGPASGSLQRIRHVGSAVGVAPPAGASGSLRGGPNPFSNRLELVFRLAAPGRARLSVHDVTGRLVSRLLDRTLGAGETRAIWDGRDEGGRRVPPGLYFARLERRGAVEAVRVLRLE